MEQITSYMNTPDCQWSKVTDLACNNIKLAACGDQQSRLNILTTLEEFTKKFTWYNYLPPGHSEALASILKYLSCSVANGNFALSLCRDQKFYTVFDELLDLALTKKNAPEPYTKYLLRLFCNLISACGNAEDPRKNITDHFSRKFVRFFMNGYGAFYEASAVLHYLFISSKVCDIQLIKTVLTYYENVTQINEFLVYFLERVFQGEFVWSIYKDQEIKARLQILQSFTEILISHNDFSEQVPPAALACLSNVFNQLANIVFQVTSPGCAYSAREASGVLEALAHLSGNEKHARYLQTDKNLFINASVMLINAHRLGKQLDSPFAPLQKLQELQRPSQATRSHPAFGFKADLVRLIGNLCWKSRTMQNLARQAEVIPVLLDCCNMDAKNPLIMQWAIMGIKNICDSNPDNQEVIGGLTQQGAVSSEVLQEFGITLHTDDHLAIGMMNLKMDR